jgi:hypothetical protein
MPKVPEKPTVNKPTKPESTKVEKHSSESSKENAAPKDQPPSQPTQPKRFWETTWFQGIAFLSSITSIIAFVVFIQQCSAPAPRTIANPKYTILVPLAATASESNTFLEKNDGSTFEAPYTNKASQNIRDIVEVAKKQWLNDNADKKLKADDIEFFCFPEGYDEDPDSFKKTFDRAMEIAKAKERKVIGVLGNVSSTSTLKYGDFCANPKEKLPMILPLATATNLMQALKLKGVPAVLRLPPANDKQAFKISDFLLKNQTYETVIIRDLTNETYSSDLIESFRENYVQRPLSVKDKSGEILGTISIGGKETSPFLYSSLAGKDGGNGLVIVGMTNSAIETLAQVKASTSKYKSIILTDGAVDEYLGERIKKIQSGEKSTSIYITFPTPCVISKSIENYIQLKESLRNNKKDFEMTHSLYVADGVYIIMSALNREITERQGKPYQENEESGILTRFIEAKKQEAVKVEEDLKKNPERKGLPGVNIALDLPFQNFDNREYIIDKFGNNISAFYYLFKLNDDLNNEKQWVPVNPDRSNTNCNQK